MPLGWLQAAVRSVTLSVPRTGCPATLTAESKPSMQPIKRKIIKELSPDSDGELELSKLLFLRFPLRLGTDVYSFGSVSKEKGKRMVEMLLAFRHLMNAYGVELYRACATSA